MKQGYHSVYENNRYQAIDFAAENGFDFVQFDLGVPNNFLDNISEQQLIHIASYAKDRNVELTFHGPCDNVSLFTDYPSIRAGILEQYKIILYKANLLNARHITLHTGRYPEFKAANKKENKYIFKYGAYYEDILHENIRKISDMSGTVLICIENDHFNSFIRKCVANLIAQEPIYLTVDIPKLFRKDITLDEDVYNFMHKNKALIREAHLHDYHMEYGRHQIIGEGKIDFTKFLELILQDNVYLNFEVRPKEAALLSMRQFEKICQNYKTD